MISQPGTTAPLAKPTKPILEQCPDETTKAYLFRIHKMIRDVLADVRRDMARDVRSSVHDHHIAWNTYGSDNAYLCMLWAHIEPYQKFINAVDTLGRRTPLYESWAELQYTLSAACDALMAKERLQREWRQNQAGSVWDENGWAQLSSKERWERWAGLDQSGKRQMWRVLMRMEHQEDFVESARGVEKISWRGVLNWPPVQPVPWLEGLEDVRLKPEDRNGPLFTFEDIVSSPQGVEL
jgi:hypothetical protein